MRFGMAGGKHPDFIFAAIGVGHHQQATETIRAKRDEALFVVVTVFAGQGQP